MLNLKLNIEEDQELRNYIKECIKNQILSIVREEIHNIVHQTIDKNIKELTGDYIQKEMMAFIKNTINNDTQRVEKGGWGITKKTIIIAAEEEVKRIVNEQLKDIKQTIKDAIRDCVV